MAFTDEERRQWHEEKRRAEYRPTVAVHPIPVAVCVSCQNPFGIGEGVITAEAALCDVCNGD